MKKSHEYDSPVLSKLVSVVTVLAICVCSICCVVTASKISVITGGNVAVQNGGNNGGATGNNGGATGNNGGATGNNGGATGNNGGATGNNGDAQTPGDNTGDAPAGDTAEFETILAKYTEVMDQLKGGVATYDKKEFQSLGEDRELGSIGNAVLGIAEGLMTTEDEAQLQNRTDMEQIPIIKNTKGCLLTDVSKIKSATMTESGGKTTIEIVLHDEESPLPAEEGATSCNSAIGSMFNPLNQAEIDNIVSKFEGLATINKFTLTGKDCTATLVFDTATGEVESLTQIMNYFIEIDAKIVIVPLAGYATLTNKMTINNVTYK